MTYTKNSVTFYRPLVIFVKFMYNYNVNHENNKYLYMKFYMLTNKGAT